ncbi:TetR family transcriptional regulator [Nocardia sp. SYP-A9097]|uniref:TetR/AcrR family transcriptional regulator n=1 Tax=Nocardia sp. SYP-A9097 TaxID=2663237 RepID=UPI00129A244A|nr:TetR family transcriptional regulator [Nocardia sp. SYP-A9097]MRH89960.1 TetR family transcriptional regulator [Nocardia sp. SYP-A9097]
MPTKREQILDGAIELLGSRGLRALTHRAVDDIAAMPSGSTSNYFRTREALLSGIADRLEERDYADWEAVSRISTLSTLPQLIDGLSALLTHTVTADRARTLARYALFLESQTTPALQLTLRRGHDRLTEWIRTLLHAVAPAAPPSTTKLLVDYIDGAALHELTYPTTNFNPHPGLDRMTRALLSDPIDT